MQVTLEQAYREATTALGEALVRERFAAQALAEAAKRIKELEDAAKPAEPAE